MNHEQANIIELEKGNLESQLVEPPMLGSPLQPSVQGIISLKLPSCSNRDCPVPFLLSWKPLMARIIFHFVPISVI